MSLVSPGGAKFVSSKSINYCHTESPAPSTGAQSVDACPYAHSSAYPKVLYISNSGVCRLTLQVKCPYTLRSQLRVPTH